MHRDCTPPLRAGIAALLAGAAAVGALTVSCSGPERPAAPVASAQHRTGEAGTPSGSLLDVDGDGTVGSYTDSLLILRYTSGFRGNDLVNGAVGPDCTRCSASEVEAYLDSL